MSLRPTRVFVAMVLGMLTALPVQAQQFRITFENLQPSGGFSTTPTWIGFHDGNFDLFDGGQAASSQLEALAELGDTGPLSTLFNNVTTGVDTTILGNGFGAGSPPIFTPGDSNSVIVDAGAGNNFFSYASMIIPSNDTFIGNGNPMGIDVSGLTNFGDTLTVDVTRFYDAGTEINDPANGAAFSLDGSTPPNGDGGADENGVVTLGDFTDFNNTFLNTNTPNGEVTVGLQSVIGRFTITAVPEPGSLGFLGALGVALGAFRRRRRS